MNRSSQQFASDAVAVDVERLVQRVQLGVHDVTGRSLLAGVDHVCGAGAGNAFRVHGDELRTARVALLHRCARRQAETENYSDHADDQDSPHEGDVNVLRLNAGLGDEVIALPLLAMAVGRGRFR